MICEIIQVIKHETHSIIFSLLTLKITFHGYSEHNAKPLLAAMRVAALTADRLITDRAFQISLK